MCLFADNERLLLYQAFQWWVWTTREVKSTSQVSVYCDIDLIFLVCTVYGGQPWCAYQRVKRSVGAVQPHFLWSWSCCRRTSWSLVFGSGLVRRGGLWGLGLRGCILGRWAFAGHTGASLILLALVRPPLVGLQQAEAGLDKNSAASQCASDVLVSHSNQPLYELYTFLLRFCFSKNSYYHYSPIWHISQVY